MHNACTTLNKKVKAGKQDNGAKKKGVKPKINTVDITDPEVYENLKREADRADVSFRKYTNDQLALRVEKERFMRSYMPKLSKLAFSEGILFIEDKDVQEIAKVGLSRKEGLVHCNFCDSESCVHIMFAMALPELGRLEHFKAKSKNSE